MLRTPQFEEKVLLERDRLADFFASNETQRIAIQKIFCKLGFSKKISMSDYAEVITNLEEGSIAVHFFGMLLLFASILVCVLVDPIYGILAIIGSVGFCVISYYKLKAKVEMYFICVRQLMKLLDCAKDICKLNIPELSSYNAHLKEMKSKFNNIKRYSFWIDSGIGTDGSIAAILMDYLKMFTHSDLIAFQLVVKRLKNQEKEINEMMDCLGSLEAATAIASFRRFLNDQWCKPELIATQGKMTGIQAEDLYHPMITEPVVNSLQENRCVLLTGSNASGKSTFLKTVAINAILAQTIYTCTAKNYRADFFRVYSSMALRDDLNNSESYYIVEIKSLKRIMDKATDGNPVPVLCFVDEVLRGTNTIERISASSQILSELARFNVMCIAATHDIELTDILQRQYANYHFQEEVVDEDVLFNYRLYEGKATSRNAIQLLKIMGYDAQVTAKADAMAQKFMNQGEWEVLA